MDVEGRVLGGLDEFMLRPGHLLVLCRVAQEVGGSWPRIQREAAERCAMSIEVKKDELEYVARYLVAKALCPRKGEHGSPSAYRYPDLEISESAGGKLFVRSLDESKPVVVSWQDRNLAHRDVRSRVGGLTWSAKMSSKPGKTGLSHVCDWAQMLELIDSAGQLTPMGRLLTTITGANQIPFGEWNPYLPGPYRIVVAHQYFSRDLDLIAHMLKLLDSSPKPLTKSECRRLFVEALKEVVERSERSQTIAPRLRFEVYQQLKDLERAASKARDEIDRTSTAWHRTASRVEVMTDLFLLQKGRQHEEEKYQYIYYVTPRLRQAVATFGDAKTGEEWLDNHLVNVVLAPERSGKPFERSSSDEWKGFVLEDLVFVAKALSLPTTLLPIDCLSLGLAYRNALRDFFPSLAELRAAIERVARDMPEIARLSRGREGPRAEYISLNLRKLPEFG